MDEEKNTNELSAGDMDQDASDEEEDEGEVPPGFEQQDKEKEYAAIFDQQKELRDELPAIQEDGSFKNPTDNNKTMTPSEVRTYVTKTRPLSNANDVPNIATIAETRALRMKKTAAGVPWAEDEKVAARSCFEASDLVIRPLMMELYAGDELRADERFKKGNGSLLIHHACGCNKHVRPLNSYSFSKRDSQRVYHGLSYTFVDYGQRYACDNPMCPVGHLQRHIWIVTNSRSTRRRSTERTSFFCSRIFFFIYSYIL
jgi:hypothetical protein